MTHLALSFSELPLPSTWQIKGELHRADFRTQTLTLHGALVRDPHGAESRHAAFAAPRARVRYVMMAEAIDPKRKVEELRTKRVQAYKDLLRNRHAALSKDDAVRAKQLEAEREARRQREGGPAGPGPEGAEGLASVSGELVVEDEEALAMLQAMFGGEGEEGEGDPSTGGDG